MSSLKYDYFWLVVTLIAFTMWFITLCICLVFYSASIVYSLPGKSFLCVCLNANFVFIVLRLGSFHPQLFQNVGTKFFLLCALQEGKASKIEWYRNDVLISSKYGQNHKIDLQEDSSMLTIYRVTPQDSANYTCIASNEVSSASQFTVLGFEVCIIRLFTNCWSHRVSRISNDMWRTVWYLPFFY